MLEYVYYELELKGTEKKSKIVRNKTYSNTHDSNTRSIVYQRRIKYTINISLRHVVQRFRNNNNMF